MREIHTIVIHCSATPEGKEFSAKDIRKWHLDKGWTDIGYHFVVKIDGTLENGRPLSRAGAHVEGHNANSIGICYIGGVDAEGKPKDTRTPEQKLMLRGIVSALRAAFPEVTRVCGHRDFPGVNKACPSFDVATEL